MLEQRTDFRDARLLNSMLEGEKPLWSDAAAEAACSVFWQAVGACQLVAQVHWPCAECKA